jgi:uncharacterized membrane protein YfcA
MSTLLILLIGMVIGAPLGAVIAFILFDRFMASRGANPVFRFNRRKR